MKESNGLASKLNLPKSGLVLSAIALTISTASVANTRPLNLHGLIGYNYTTNQTDLRQGSESQHLLLNLNASSYVWQPWFLTWNGGATLSQTGTTNDLRSSYTDVVSGRFNMDLLPRSRFPFFLGYTHSTNVDDWHDETLPYRINLGDDYRTRNLLMRQSLITPGGNRLDAWYNNRLRGSGQTGDMVDDTLGLKAKWRFRVANIYADYSQQTQNQSLSDRQILSKTANTMLNFFPTSSFYNKTLFNYMQVENRTLKTDAAFFSETRSDVFQFSDNFYWRPVYKPYVVSGAFRYQGRDVDFYNEDNGVTGITSISGQLGLNYEVTRRMRMIVSAGGSKINKLNENRTLTNDQATESFDINGSAGLTYNTDTHFVKGFTWSGNWQTNYGGNLVGEYTDLKDDFHRLNAGIGHRGSRTWITGNRSSVRLSLNESVNQSFDTRTDESPFNLTHSASLAWNERLRSGSSYAQAMLLDNRLNLNESSTQLFRLQYSRSMPIDRLSTWSGHARSESSRRATQENPDPGIITTITGRLNYQHSRLFGIYRLRFKTKVDGLYTILPDADGRASADLESRVGYQLGKLGTSLVGRRIFNFSGMSSWMALFQLNRSF